jgi:large subunit ribosomal protein L18e
MKNEHTSELIRALLRAAIEQQVPLWKRVAQDLDKPSRQQRTVNIFKIEEHAADGEILLVPGKVLGEGDLTKSVTVAAHHFSQGAIAKINRNGKAMTIAELIKSNPKAQKVRILG